MNAYLQGVIARLKSDQDDARDLVECYQSRLAAAKEKHIDISRNLQKYERQALVEKRIEKLGIRAQTLDLAKWTRNRCNENKYLREGNDHIRSAYFRINTLVENGIYPKWDPNSDLRQKEIRVLGWCMTIMSYDSADKTQQLANDISFEVNRIRDEIANRKETTNV